LMEEKGQTTEVASSQSGGTDQDVATLRVAQLNAALQVLNENSLVDVMEGLETLLVYTKNLILFPDEKKFRKVKKSNPHFNQRLGHLQGAEAAMQAIGYLPSGEYLRADDLIKSEGNAAALRALEKLLSARLNEVKKSFSELPHRLECDHSFRAVRGAAIHSEIGKRNNMEDDAIIIDCFANDDKQAYFGLYDGHGGRATVDFVVKTLHMNLEQQLKLYPQKPFAELYLDSYLATDGQLRRQNILRSGTTSVTCVVRKTEQAITLFTANVGDSRAVLCRDGVAARLTLDHKATLPEEIKRITDAGGFIGRNKRVNGVLAITRALGDHMLKENDIVSAVPHTSEVLLEPSDNLLIIACDGVWDVISDQEAVDLVRKKVRVDMAAAGEPQAGASYNAVLMLAAKALVKEALDRHSLDNITAMVISV